ncbi:hypothetical protein LSH36_1308g00014 [Paralvinella palmiformis]|uniref:Uncharacterized protein n=1 Tax=Paralvinella palmiformis TaxID=53620 RepID=A0AAD9ITS3_9ANNE|nr:hypothetical protein LSH36_1308g00014 [Paralvinella palmiformis]
MAEVPIDKGVAWFILLGAFISGFFTVGGFKSVGILFVHVLERYEASQSLTAWMMGLMSFGLAIYSPISTAVGIRYTYRVSVMLGGFAMHLGFLLCVFAPNVYFIIAVLGGFIGFGNGFLYTPSMIMVGQYFDKHRSLAMGIAAAGGSFGQLVVPLIIRFLLDHYGYQGCMLIYSGIVLNGVVGGALLRPQSFYRSGKRRTNGRVFKVEHDAVADQMVHTPSHSVNSLTFKSQIQDSLTSTPVCALDGSPHVASLENMEETILNSGPESQDHNVAVAQDPDCDIQTDGQKIDKNELEVVSNTERDITSGGDDEVARVGLALLYRSTGSLQMVDVNSDRNRDAEDPGLCDSKQANIEDLLHKEKNCWIKCCYICCSPFVKLFDRAFLIRSVFWLYFFGVCFANAGYIDQFIFIPPFAKEIGISKFHTAGILAASGVADLIGRLAGGFFNSLRLLKTNIFMSLTLFISGVGILVTLVFHSYPSLMVHGIILGLIGGMYIAMVPIVLVHIVGLSKFPQAFAFTMMGVGFTNLPLPSLFGKISEIRGSYTLSFILLNVMMVCSGFLFIILSSVQSREDRRQKGEKTDKDKADLEDDK